MKKSANANLFAALRAAFPADLDGIAVETDSGLFYSWRDLERASAMIANLLDALKLEKGARIAVQVEKSVEAMLLYLATLRAGYVFLPLNTAYQSAEIEYFIGNAEPAVVVCTSRNASWVAPIATAAGTKHVFTDPRDLATHNLLARRAQRHGTLGADWRIAGWTLGAEVQTSSRRYDDAANSVKLGGYTVLNLSATTQLTRDINLVARVDNVGNKDYQFARLYANAGRTAYVGLKWTPH